MVICFNYFDICHFFFLILKIRKKRMATLKK